MLLPAAMRDFAVAAGIAAAAFGPAAAAPLGAYGVLVLLAGSLAAIIARHRTGARRHRPGKARSVISAPCPPVRYSSWPRPAASPASAAARSPT